MSQATIQRLTLQKIADMVGVSKTVVSKVVNHASVIPVGEAKRRQIEAIVREYNYTPLSAAQNLATRRTRQISFMLSTHKMHGFENQYFAKLLNGVYEACHVHGYQCVINTVDCSDIGSFMMPENLMKRSIDGCVLVGYYDEDVLKQLVSVQLPMVMLACGTLNPGIPSVSQDERKTFDRILTYLYGRGHRHVGIASGSEADRRIFHELASRYAGMRISCVQRGGVDDDYVLGKRVAETFAGLSEECRPTVYFGSIHFSVSFIRTLQGYGLRCPDDISVFTGLDTELAQWFEIPLTGTRMELHQMGHDSADLLVKLIEGELEMSEACRQAASLNYSCEIIEQASVKTLN